MKKIFFIAVAALALAACDKNDDSPVPSSMVAEISATIRGNVPSRAKDSSWDDKDNIGITASAGNQINVKYTFSKDSEDTGSFSGNPIYFYKQMSATAYYPFTGIEGEEPGTIDASTDMNNQSAENQPFIDFLWDEKSVDISTDIPKFEFEFTHKMSKLSLVLKSGNGGTDVKKITSCTITGLVLDGTFNTATGECAVKTEVESADLTLTPTIADDGSVALPSLILFPQPAKNVKLKIKDSDNQDYICDLNKFTDNALKSGESYLYTISVKKTELSVDFSINNWTTKEIGGEASSDDSDDTEDTNDPEDTND